MRFSLQSLAVVSVLLGSARSVVVPAVASTKHYHPEHTNVEFKGKNETINGVLTYVSLPKKHYDKSIALLMLTDVFGLPSVDNLLLADEWAEAGFATYAPDYLNGDALPLDGDVNTWLPNHSEAVTNPPLLAVYDAIKASGVEKIAVTAYCFGGLYALRFVQNNTIAVATMAHPFDLDVPSDFELAQAQSHIPFGINSAELDFGFTPPLAEEADAVMVGYEPGYYNREFLGVGHGFAVTANASDPVQVAAKKGAFDTSLAWIKSHLDC